MVSVTRTLKRWVTALARRMGVDANPLRRGCDRAEGWVRLGLVVVFLVASPLAAIGLGHLTNDASIRAARAQAASRAASGWSAKSFAPTCKTSNSMNKAGVSAESFRTRLSAG